MQFIKNNIQRMQRALDDQGFIVMVDMPGPKPSPKIGDILAGPLSGVPGPFKVIGVSTEQEMITQVQHYGDDYHRQMLSIGWYKQARGFYRLIAE